MTKQEEKWKPVPWFMGILAALIVAAVGAFFIEPIRDAVFRKNQDDVRKADGDQPPPFDTENYACAAVNGPIQILDRDGNRHSVPAPGQSDRIYVNNSKVTWFCGTGELDWTPPPDADYIIVSRNDRGSGVVNYYRKD